MRIDRALQPTSLRLSLIYSGLLIGSFALAAALIWAGSRGAAEAEIRKFIELEAGAIANEIEFEGIDAAIAAIEFRAEKPGAFEYWLTDASGRRLFGDLPAMEGPNGWRRLDVPDGIAAAEGREEMLILTQSFANGVRLSVGDDLARSLVVRRGILKTLVLVGSASVLASILAGFMITRRTMRRMNQLTRTIHAVAGGDLEARFPTRAGASGSDVESIGEGVNAMLDRIAVLVGGIRRVSRDVAHDLRTPLSHLQQRLEQAKAESSPEMMARRIDEAQEKVGEVLRIFDAILRLAEIEAGSARQRFESVNLAGIAEKIGDAYRPDVEQAGRTLTVECHGAASVSGDPTLLAQALANLLENAIRYTPPGAKISIKTVADDQSVRLEVADDGPGIDPDRIAEALKPFGRLDQSRSSAGAGLGLAIVEAVARLHHARLTLSNAQPGLQVVLDFARENRGS
ncbi:MAG: sensor histidine kinase [Parvularculaceae bacterium]